MKLYLSRDPDTDQLRVSTARGSAKDVALNLTDDEAGYYLRIQGANDRAQTELQQQRWIALAPPKRVRMGRGQYTRSA